MMDEKPFVYRTNALTLLEIGAFNLAREFWRHELQSYIKSLILRTSENSDENYTSISLNYPKCIPNSIRELTNKHILFLKIEIDEWAKAPENQDFRNTTKFNIPVIFTHFDDIVWRADYTINHDRTAKNMMKSTKLDNWQKFSLACGYCFEKEVEILWKLQFPWYPQIRVPAPIEKYVYVPMPYPLNLFLSVDHPGYYFVNFQCTDLSRRGQRILISPYFGRKNITLRQASHKNQTGFEYLWDTIEPYLQVDILIYSIQNRIQEGNRCRINFHHIFPKLSTQQWHELVTKYGASLMIFLMNKNFFNVKEPDYVLQVWTHICKMVSGEKLIYIITNILDTCELCHKYYEDCWHKEIWISASDEIKQVALNNFLDTIPCRSSIPRFCILILRSASFKQRKEFCRIHEQILKRDFSESDLRRILCN